MLKKSPEKFQDFFYFLSFLKNDITSQVIVCINAKNKYAKNQFISIPLYKESVIQIINKETKNQTSQKVIKFIGKVITLRISHKVTFTSAKIIEKIKAEVYQSKSFIQVKTWDTINIIRAVTKKFIIILTIFLLF